MHAHRRLPQGLTLAAGLVLGCLVLPAHAAPRADRDTERVGWRMDWEMVPAGVGRDAPASRTAWSKLRNLDQGGFSWDFNAPNRRRPLPELRWGPRYAAGASARLRYSRWSAPVDGAQTPSGRVPQVLLTWRY